MLNIIPKEISVLAAVKNQLYLYKTGAADVLIVSIPAQKAGKVSLN